MKIQKDNGIGTLIFIITSCILCILSFSVTLYYYLHPQTLGEMPFIPGGKLPDVFVVNTSLIGPAADQMDRGTCWIFETVAIIESFYKKQALEKKALKENEFLKISEEALGKLIIDVCHRHRTDPVCAYSPRLENTTTSGDIYQFFTLASRYPAEFEESLVPESCCPYHEFEEKDTDKRCPSYYSTCIKQNPIKFHVDNNSIFTSSNIKETLYRLVKFQMPIAMETFMPQSRYWIPCSNPMVKNKANCIGEDFSCPNVVAGEEFCYPVDFKLYKKSNTPFEFVTNRHTVPGTGHALLMVGYNQHLVIKSALNYSETPYQMGGFILRNSWGKRGHTLEYLSGNITLDQDSVFCPNSDDPMRWVPASYECLKSINFEEDRIKKCSKDAHLVRGNTIQNSADILECFYNDTMTHCKVGDKYVLLRETDDGPPVSSIEWSKQGMPMAKVVNLRTKEIETISTLPIHHIYFALKLKNSKLIENKQECGYVFFPFETLDELSRTAGGGIQSRWNTRGIDIKFEDRSFYGASGKYNYSWISNSIVKKELLKPKSMIDLDL